MKPTKEQIYQIGKEKFVSDLKPYWRINRLTPSLQANQVYLRPAIRSDAQDISDIHIIVSTRGANSDVRSSVLFFLFDFLEKIWWIQGKYLHLPPENIILS